MRMNGMKEKRSRQRLKGLIKEATIKHKQTNKLEHSTNTGICPKSTSAGTAERVGAIAKALLVSGLDLIIQAQAQLIKR